MINKSLILSLMLFGNITNSYGRVGIRISSDGHVNKVHRFSPSAGLIYPGDDVIECDGVAGCDKVDGIAETEAHITIRRLGKLHTFIIKRVPKEEIKD